MNNLPTAAIAALLAALLPLSAHADVRPVIGQARNSPLDTPFGVAFLPGDHDLVIVEYDGERVFKLDAAGDLHLLAGEHRNKGYRGDGKPAAQARFDGMHALAIAPDGTLYIADTWNQAVRTIAPDGTAGTLAGTGEPGFGGDGGPAKDAQFDSPINVELSADAKTLYVVDLKNRRLRAIDLGSGQIETVAGNGYKGVPTDGKPAQESPLVDPRAVAAAPDGTLYLLERAGNAIRKITPDGLISTVAGTGKKGSEDGAALQATFDGPKDLAVAKDGSVYVADAENNLIRKFDPKEETVTTVVGGDENVDLARPHGVTIAPNGDLYIVDSYNHRVLRLTLETEDR